MIKKSGVVLVALVMALSQDMRAAKRVQVNGLDTSVYLTVVPKPRQEKYENLFFTFSKPAIEFKQQIKEKDLLLKNITEYFKKKLNLSLAGNVKADNDLIIRVTVNAAGSELYKKAASHPEGYTLAINESKGVVEVSLSGNSARGVQHALQSLKQLLISWNGKSVIRKAELVDWPTFKFRFVKRYTKYWMEQSSIYKMNGMTVQAAIYHKNIEKTGKRFDKVMKISDKYLLDSLVMVSMGNILYGTKEWEKRVNDYFTMIIDSGFSHVAIMFDDKMTALDKVGYDRFKTYINGQLYYTDKVHKLFEKKKPSMRMGFMPNYYHGEKMADYYGKGIHGKINKDIAFFWAGYACPGHEAAMPYLKKVLAQSGLDKMWFYMNWPQCGKAYWAPNHGPMRNRDFGDGKIVELVTVSTTNAPRAFPVSFITVCDYLWNPEAYDPDESLKRATKEVVPPGAYKQFYALFKFIDKVGGFVENTERNQMYASENPTERRSIIIERCEKLDKLVAACEKTKVASKNRVKILLDKIKGKKDKYLKRLALLEKLEAGGVKAKTVACPTLDRAPKLGGAKPDAIWSKAAKGTGFTDMRGEKKAPYQTAFKIFQDKDNIYLRVECEEPFMSELINSGFTYPRKLNEGTDGFLWWYDDIEVFLDPGHDGRKVRQMIFNPIGMKEFFQFDSVKYGYYGKENFSRTSLPVSGYALHSKNSWALELVIPKSIFADDPAKDSPIWGFEVCRTRKINKGIKFKYSAWSPLTWGFQEAKNFGNLKMK